MQRFSGFHEHLLKLESDGEITMALKEFFSEFGAVSSANRFFALDEAGKRFFLIQFKEFSDAIKAVNRYRLRSFGFDGVLVEVAKDMGRGSTANHEMFNANRV